MAVSPRPLIYFFAYLKKGPIMSDLPVVIEVVLSKKDMRKIFRTILLGNIVAYTTFSLVKKAINEYSD